LYKFHNFKGLKIAKLYNINPWKASGVVTQTLLPRVKETELELNLIENQMKYKQNALVFRNQFTRILLIIIFLFITQYSYSQKTRIHIDSTYSYKNAIKGITTILPFIGLGIYASFSVGYERNISKHSVLELGSYYLFNTDEMGVRYHTICVMPAYKYFTVSNKKGLNSLWVSVYLSYRIEIETFNEGGNVWYTFYYYGIGGSIGKKVYLSKDKKWFLDIGFGISYNIYDDKPIFSTNDWIKTFDGYQVLLRPIIQIGWKF
jgi:hypothetical protein